MSTGLVITGGELQILGVLFAWRALQGTRTALNGRAAAATASQNPIVPPGPLRTARLNLATDIAENLRPRHASRDEQIRDDAIKTIHAAQVAAEQRAWAATDALEKFTAALVRPSRPAVWSGVLIIAGLVVATIGSVF
jgi:hypothetical protein